MKCKIPICNLCCQPEFDDNVNGWLSGKQVGYCYSCSRKLNWKRTFLEDKTRRTKRNDEEDIREAEGNKDEGNDEFERLREVCWILAFKLFLAIHCMLLSIFVGGRF